MTVTRKVNFKVLVVGDLDVSHFLREELLATHEKSSLASSMKLDITAFDETFVIGNGSYDFVVVAAYNNLAGLADLEQYLLQLPMNLLTSKKICQVLMATVNTSVLGHEAVEHHQAKWPFGITFMYEETPTSIETGMKRLWQTIIKAV